MADRRLSRRGLSLESRAHITSLISDTEISVDAVSLGVAMLATRGEVPRHGKPLTGLAKQACITVGYAFHALSHRDGGGDAS